MSLELLACFVLPLKSQLEKPHPLLHADPQIWMCPWSQTHCHEVM